MPEQLEISGTETPAKTVNRHVVLAVAHLNKRREALLAKRRELDEEIEGIDQAILALE